MAQWLKAHTSKFGDLRLRPPTQRIEERMCSRKLLSDIHMWATAQACVHTMHTWTIYMLCPRQAGWKINMLFFFSSLVMTKSVHKTIKIEHKFYLQEHGNVFKLFPYLLLSLSCFLYWSHWFLFLPALSLVYFQFILSSLYSDLSFLFSFNSLLPFESYIYIYISHICYIIDIQNKHLVYYIMCIFR